MTQKELEARASIAGDLFREGKILRVECFRLEMDAALGEDTGDIRYCDNRDFELGEM
jgi:hypothetical protein